LFPGIAFCGDARPAKRADHVVWTCRLQIPVHYLDYPMGSALSVIEMMKIQKETIHGQE
jgi:hypothetical protein